MQAEDPCTENKLKWKKFKKNETVTTTKELESKPFSEAMAVSVFLSLISIQNDCIFPSPPTLLTENRCMISRQLAENKNKERGMRLKNTDKARDTVSKKHLQS